MQFIDEIELADELAKDTTTTIVVDIPTAVETETQTAENFDKDFDQNILNEPVDKLEDNANAAMYDSSKLSPVIIDGAEMLIKQLLPILYEKSAFTKDEIIGMKAFSYKQNIQKNKRETVIEENDEQFAAMVADYENYVNSLEFTVTEKKSLIAPLTELLKNVNYQTSPSNALLIAVLMVMLPRLLPVGIKKFSTKK